MGCASTDTKSFGSCQNVNLTLFANMLRQMAICQIWRASMRSFYTKDASYDGRQTTMILVLIKDRKGSGD